jgi:hypothetical protein
MISGVVVCCLLALEGAVILRGFVQPDQRFPQFEKK